MLHGASKAEIAVVCRQPHKTEEAK